MQKKIVQALSFFSILAVTVLPSLLDATIVKNVSFDRQCEQAEIIVNASVSSVTSRRLESKSLKIIVSDVRFRIIEAVKGSASGSVTVTIPGGTIGNERLEVPGTPSFEQGDNWVLFLVDNGIGSYRVVGFNQGCYRVLTDENGTKVIGPSVVGTDSQVTLAGDSSKNTAAPSGTVKEFIAKVKANLGKNSRTTSREGDL